MRKLLALNDGAPAEAPRVEVILLSRNSSDTGLRIFNSIEHYGLDIARAAFTSGAPTMPYVQPFGADLFLSANPESVRRALAHGVAAATILPPRRRRRNAGGGAGAAEQDRERPAADRLRWRCGDLRRRERADFAGGRLEAFAGTSTNAHMSRSAAGRSAISCGPARICRRRFPAERSAHPHRTGDGALGARA